jgi:HSP20 family molecular chaperone IbpA
MKSVSEEMQQLHVRILELEKKQKELDENNKKTNIANDRYSKSVPLARYCDQEMVMHLHATYILYTM